MAECDDPFDLQRFIDAQAPVIERARSELASGRKASHWMWFVFPQIAGLGSSEMARRYAIATLDEAAAFLAHPVLGPRLRELTGLVNAIEGASARDIFGAPDDLKFHSSMTLFAQAAPEDRVFQKALDRYFAGASDRASVERLVGDRGGKCR
jgi:uncharacterized protein (DUF1810 family)